jgi:hypothetical protein
MQKEFLYEEKLKLLPPTDIGLVPEGRRVDVPFSGDATGPSIRGKVEGVDYVLFRPDGVILLHVHAVLTMDGGDRVSIEVSGFATDAGEGRFDRH